MLRLAFWLVDRAKWLVPARDRDDWCETWKSELWHHARERLDRAQQMDLLRRSLGAYSHALWLAGRAWRFSLVYQDLIYGLRGWLAEPLFALVALLTLALGIGANTYIFSVVDGLLLHPFPYRDVDRLVALGATFPQLSAEERFIEAVSVPDFLEIRARSRTLEEFLAFDLGNRDLGGIDEPERLFTAAFWGDPFQTLGMEPALGRSFTAEEIETGAPVAIVSHRVWQNQLGGDPAAIGKPIIVNGAPHTLVGVMPPRLLLLDTDLWLPMWYRAAEMPRSRRVLTVLARVDDDRALEDVRAELEVFASRIARESASEAPEYAGFRLSATPYVDVWASFVGPAAPLLLGAVGFVLLIVCANIAGLLLARGATRRHEMAIRVAIGAGKGRLVQQLLTESSSLAIGGGLLGVGIAHAGIRATSAYLPSGLPLGGIEIAINESVLGYTAAISILSGIFFGLFPALQASHVDVHGSLVADGGRTTGSGSGLRVRRAFVTFQIALCLVLLTGAGLLLKSFGNLTNVDPGVAVDNVLTMRLTLAWERYQGRFESFYTELIEEVERIPGVRSVGIATQFPPLVRQHQPFQIEGAELLADGSLPSANVTVVSPGFFETLGMSIIRGRDLGAHERQSAPPVAILNQAAASRYFPDRDPLGRRIKIGGTDSDAPWSTVVGIVSDAKNRGVDRETAPEMFHSYLQHGQWANQMFLLVRTSGDPMAALPAVREALKRIDPHQPVYAIDTLRGRFHSTLLTRRLVGVVLVALAAVALLLAAMGVYAVVAFMVSERRRELGVRIALGASSRQLLASVLVRAAKLVVAGVAFGIFGAVALARTMRGFLFDVSPYDPGILVVTAMILAGVTLAAALAPARRAPRVDPVETFK